MSPDIRVVIADDEPLVRAALRELLAAGGLDVVAEAASAEEAVAACRRHAPDVAVLDVRMPGEGPTASAAITGEGLAGRVVALSSDDHPTARRRMAEAGATTFVVKAGDDDIVQVVRAAWAQRPGDA